MPDTKPKTIDPNKLTIPAEGPDTLPPGPHRTISLASLIHPSLPNYMRIYNALVALQDATGETRVTAAGLMILLEMDPMSVDDQRTWHASITRLRKMGMLGDKSTKGGKTVATLDLEPQPNGGRMMETESALRWAQHFQLKAVLLALKKPALAVVRPS